MNEKGEGAIIYEDMRLNDDGGGEDVDGAVVLNKDDMTLSFGVSLFYMIIKCFCDLKRF